MEADGFLRLPRQGRQGHACRMDLSKRSDLTLLLNRMLQGDQTAGNVAMRELYPALKRVASTRLRSERPGHLLDTTALFNEVMVRVFGSKAMVVQATHRSSLAGPWGGGPCSGRDDPLPLR